MRRIKVGRQKGLDKEGTDVLSPERKNVRNFLAENFTIFRLFDLDILREKGQVEIFVRCKDVETRLFDKRGLLVSLVLRKRVTVGPFISSSNDRNKKGAFEEKGIRII